MGCICSKASAIEDIRESPIENPPGASSLIGDETFEAKDRIDSSDRRVRLTDEKTNGSSTRSQSRNFERRTKTGYAGNHHPGMGKIPKVTEGELVVAGWPAWLVAVAGEAINGWVPRRADSFEKLDVIGRGSYSTVYKSRDLLTGKIVALKKVWFNNLESDSVKFMAREIIILRRLDHPNVTKLEGLVTSRMSCSLYLVFEYMEHDLTGLASNCGFKLTEPEVKCYMQQLLLGLDHCHSRGVLHRDIKCSNLLIDNSGILKIADFGLSSFYDPHHGHPLTSRVVTLWYRPPELLLGANYYGVAVDLWSTGCILAELYAGKPIMPARTEVEQLHKIFKLCGSPSEDYWKKSKLPHKTIFKPQQPYRRCVADTFKDFPPAALGLIETLLSIDPTDRGTAASALNSEFFTTNPLACDPSSLPEYPPSKELDAKVRGEKARRQGAEGGKGQRFDQVRRRPRESQAIPGSDASTESVLSMQNRHGQSDSKSRSKKLNSQQDEAASIFRIDHLRQLRIVEKLSEDSLGSSSEITSHSGPLAHRIAPAKANLDGALKGLARADLSTSSGLVPESSLLSKDLREKSGPSKPEPINLLSSFAGSSKEGSESTRKRHQKHHAQDVTGSHSKNYGRASNKEPVLRGYGSKGSKTADYSGRILGSSSNADQILTDQYRSKGNKTHYSGPLLSSSSSVDQILMDHDRQIQDLVQRTRFRYCKS